MQQDTVVQEEMQAITRAYLQAFEERDVDGCMEFFADTATISFYFGQYSGSEEIRQWHVDRFAAEAHMLGLERIVTQGDSVVVDGIATSKRIKAWRIGKVAGTLTLQFDRQKIADAKYVLRFTSPF
jgi:hypothetical protein